MMMAVVVINWDACWKMEESHIDDGEDDGLLLLLLLLLMMMIMTMMSRMTMTV